MGHTYVGHTYVGHTPTKVAERRISSYPTPLGTTLFTPMALGACLLQLTLDTNIRWAGSTTTISLSTRIRMTLALATGTVAPASARRRRRIDTKATAITTRAHGTAVSASSTRRPRIPMQSRRRTWARRSGGSSHGSNGSSAAMDAYRPFRRTSRPLPRASPRRPTAIYKRCERAAGAARPQRDRGDAAGGRSEVQR